MLNKHWTVSITWFTPVYVSLSVGIKAHCLWSRQVLEIRKANKWLFFLRLLKNACPNREDLVVTYTSLVKQIVECACPVWHAGLPQHLQKEVETIQKRALTTIYGLARYEEHLCASGLVSLKDRRVKICSDLFNEMCKPDYKLNLLIPKPVNVVNPWEIPHQFIPLNLEQIIIETLSFHMLWWTFSNFDFDFIHKW